MNTQDMAKELHGKLKEKVRIEEMASQCEKQIRALQSEMVKAFDEEGIDAVKVEGIEYKPVTEQDFSLADGGVKWDDYPAWFEWLKEIGEEGMIKTKASVHPGTRKAFLKEYIENGNVLPAFIRETYYQSNQTSRPSPGWWPLKEHHDEKRNQYPDREKVEEEEGENETGRQEKTPCRPPPAGSCRGKKAHYRHRGKNRTGNPRNCQDGNRRVHRRAA